MKFIKKSFVRVFEKQRDPNDPRLKNIIRPWDEKDTNPVNVGILGIPFDYGVRISQGRTGAAKAPDEIRLQMKRYGTAFNVWHKADLSKISVVDFENIEPARKNVEETHERVTRAVQKLFGICDTLIVLGGGHDLTFATVRGLARTVTSPILGPLQNDEARQVKLGGMNVDAHLDVREVHDGRISSGTPFRRLIEHKIIEGKDLFEIGLQAQVNSKYYWEWAEKQGVHLVPLPVIRECPQGIKDVLESFKRHTEHLSTLFVSIDIDSVAQAFAPGSSAPSPDGLFPQEILALAYEVGTMPNVKLFEIMEVNPLFDQDHRTSRLAVNIILEFLAGYVKRKPR